LWLLWRILQFNVGLIVVVFGGCGHLAVVLILMVVARL
jgi:hypothetical protein